MLALSFFLPSFSSLPLALQPRLSPCSRALLLILHPSTFIPFQQAKRDSKHLPPLHLFSRTFAPIIQATFPLNCAEFGGGAALSCRPSPDPLSLISHETLTLWDFFAVFFFKHCWRSEREEWTCTAQLHLSAPSLKAPTCQDRNRCGNVLLNFFAAGSARIINALPEVPYSSPLLPIKRCKHQTLFFCDCDTAFYLCVVFFPSGFEEI